MSTGSLSDIRLGAEAGSIFARSPLRYPGGKQKAIKEIAKMLPSGYSEYREPMVGGGSVYLHARSVNLAQKYWINDQFAELIAFWKTIQNESLCVRLQNDLEELRSNFKNAEEIEKFFLKSRSEQPNDEYRLALLFFFFNRVTFSGTTRAGGFSKAASLSRFTASSIKRLQPMPNALQGTKITNLDFESLIKAPGDQVFVFLDPPYYTASKLYGKNGILHAFDHDRLADVLRNSDHDFLITYDDCPQIEKLYSWANIIPWRLQYGMNNCSKSGQSKIGSELFISNYDFSHKL